MSKRTGWTSWPFGPRIGVIDFVIVRFSRAGQRSRLIHRGGSTHTGTRTPRHSLLVDGRSASRLEDRPPESCPCTNPSDLDPPSHKSRSRRSWSPPATSRQRNRRLPRALRLWQGGRRVSARMNGGARSEGRTDAPPVCGTRIRSADNAPACLHGVPTISVAPVTFP